MATIWRPTYRAKDGTKKVSRKWWIDYTDAKGKRQHVPGFRDKKATLTKAAALERNAERARAGLQVLSDQFHEPIAETIQAYLDELRRLGRSAAHVANEKGFLERLVTGCGWKTLADMNENRLTEFLARLQKEGKAPRTQNAYRDSAVAFCNYCVRRHWLLEIRSGWSQKPRPGEGILVNVERSPGQSFSVLSRCIPSAVWSTR
jgi:hypothetical protein